MTGTTAPLLLHGLTRCKPTSSMCTTLQTTSTLGCQGPQMGAQKVHCRMPRLAVQHSLSLRSKPSPQEGKAGDLLGVWPPLIVQTRDPRHLPTLPMLRGGCRLAPRPSPHPYNCPSNRNTFPLSLTQVCVSNPSRTKPRAPHLPAATAGPRSLASRQASSSDPWQLPSEGSFLPYQPT